MTALSTLLVNLRYDLPAKQVGRFRRSALLDIDPGLMQMWVSVGRYSPARHDLYFTIGETVGTANARFPSCGVEWHYTPPPVFLPQWMPVKAAPIAPYTTVAHWWGEEIQFNGVPINTEKRECPVAQIMNEGVQACQRSIGVFLQVPVTIEKRIRISSFKTAKLQIMNQRIHTRSFYLQILFQIPLTVEETTQRRHGIVHELPPSGADSSTPPETTRWPVPLNRAVSLGRGGKARRYGRALYRLIGILT
jgi:hypothetical protein